MPDYHKDLQTFLIPLSECSMTLAMALKQLEAIGNAASEVPFIVQMMENPSFDFPPFSMFKGRVSLLQHDCIHLLLGRGTTLVDEAFTIGFTMGSSKSMSTTASKIFAYVAEHWYPKAYRFPDYAREVYTNAVHLGMVSRCHSLDEVDFEPYFHQPLGEVRVALGLELNLLKSYYAVEAMRNPDLGSSQRLLS